MHDRFVLLKRESELTDQEALKLSGWVENYPELGLAYRLKEDFFTIYDSQSKEEAFSRYAAWEISVTEEVRDAFSDLIKAWRNWQPHILAYFNRFTFHPHALTRVSSAGNPIGTNAVPLLNAKRHLLRGFIIQS